MAKSPRSRAQSSKMTKAQFEEALRRERAAHRQTAAALTEAQARLTEALDGQTATSEILRVIANSPTDVRPAFAALAASAADLCDAYDAVIFHVDGHVLRLVAHEGPVALGPVGQFTTPLARGYLTGRVALDRRTIQIADHQVEGDEYPEGTLLAQRMGVRTMLGVPLLRAGEAIGVIALRRSEVRLFSDREIDLLQTFADQAVIAIENVRLFTELQTRNADLTEALDRQTATSEILRIISSSRTDVQPVFDTIAASASRLCGDAAAIVTRFDGEMVHLVAHHNPRPGIVPATARLYPRPLSRDTTTGRAILEGRIVHIPDAAMDQDLAPNLARDVRAGSFLAVPMLRDGRPIGAISVSRAEAGAFPSGQITLLQTFADQAVIAIENVRLFTELQASNRELTRALETQTATSDILGVISRSQTDVQPVFDAILASAVDLLRGESGALTRVAGDQIELAALTSADETAEAAWRARFPRPLHAPGMHATAMGDRAPLNIADSETDARVSEAARAVARLQGFRSWVVVPLLRQHEAIGTIAVNRREPGGFAADEIALLETFADQAVIAIENARLLGELQEKNRALTEAHERVSEALDRQTATSEILRVISQSPTDVRPVFDVILESAVPLCSARFGVVYRYDGELIHIMAHHNFSPEAVALLSRDYPAPPGGGTVSARAIAEREVVQIYDSTDPARAPRKSVDIARALQYRAMVSVPMLRDGQPIGAITLARREAGAFSDTHIAMLRTFADQAVIAIENVRLFTELQQKNSALTDALGQQTATADILGVISRSPTDAQPVFEAIVSSAVRLCEGTHGAVLRVNGDVIDHVAAFAHDPAVLDQIRSHYPRRLSEVGPGAGFRALRERRVVEIADIDIAPDVADFIRQTARRMGFRSEVWMPMLRGEETLGAIGVTRREPGGFSTNQIALLRSFADQAVIAIENVRLFTELQEKNRAVTEALDQQSATSEVLRVISGSPTDLRPVFDAILARALRLCGGLYGGIFMIDTAGHIDLVAHTEVNEDAQRAFRAYFPRPVADLEWGSYIAGVVRDGMTVHVADVLADSTANDAARALARSTGYRAVLFVPFVRNGRTIGLLSVTRAEPEPFTPAQVALIESFAAQGLIAIENVRLFTELQERNRALTQALDEQTATGNILRVISGSPTDIRPVFQAIMDSAARLLRAHSGAVTRVVEDRIELVALTASDEAAEAVLKANYPMTLDSGTSHALTIQSRRPFNVHDCETDPRLTDAGRRTARARGYRSQLLVPMLRHDQPLGAISLTRREPGGFKDEEIALLQTFADQAVIAIENVRLFTELQASNRELTTALDTQTATSDILRVISRSQTDVQPVFQTIVDSAERLLRGNSAVLSRIAGDRIELAAFTHTDDGGDALLKSFFPMSLQSSGAETRPIRDRVIGAREPYNVADMEIDPRVGERGRANARARGYRSQLVVPMLRHDEPIGTIAVTRPDPGAFTEDEIALLTTFADQAVIAIENARLFTELQEKNRALTDALDQQTATGEILRVISESPTDVQPVFDAIVRNAGRVCDANDAALFVVDGDVIVQTAHWGPIDTLGQGARVPLTRTTGAGRAVLDTVTVHVTDLASDPDFPEGREFAARFGYRTIVAVPLIREAKAIGALLMRRTDVRLFTDKQIEMLRLFADQAVIAIENVRLFAELQARTHDLTRSVDQLTALGEVSRAVSSTLDLDRVLDTVVNRATQLAGADGCSIWEYDADVDGFRMRATSQISGELVDRQRAIPVRAGEGAVGRLRETRAPVQIPDITVAEAYRGSLRDTLVTGGFRALLAVPMIQEDRVVGGLVVSRKTSGEFPPETVELLQTFANQSALAIANARLFREIEEKSAQLEVANQHKSEFLANMSHELRTPLNAVIGFSDVLLEGMFGEINEKQTEYLRDILSSGTHLLSLINDILDLSKIEAGRMELDLTDFDVPSAIGNALTLMRERASRHGIVLTQMVDSGLGEIRADERKFKQVLLNLLSNAVKFTPSGGKVEVRARHHDGMVEVAVADTGEGIALEDQQAVFEEFRQVGKTSKKIEGTGLGLALCRKFVELHGGTLGVESQVGVGSTFTFTLPVLESRPVDHGAARLRGGGDDHG